ncbi:MAG TPA: flavin reductase family protein [Gaiella sp.]|jgi:flavin reductase (DIM6/NTAB) family NADH-FMN oxidoreductase RutF
MSLRSAGARRRDVAAHEYVAAMTSLASGVVVVTGRHEGRPWGMTVTAFASVSVEPPTVLVSLGSRTVSAGAIAATGAFGVSILTRDQLDVAEYGARSGAPKFLDTLVERGERASASPAIANALAHFDCTVVDAVDVADHTVFFGDVRAVRSGRCGEPLVYHGRGYGSFSPVEPATERTLRCISS